MAKIQQSALAFLTSVSDMEAADADEDFGEDMDNEVVLLEQAVRKIATLAQLCHQKNPFDDETLVGMKNEELGILALTTVNPAAPSVPMASTLSSDGAATNRTEITVTMQWQLEEIGLTYDTLNS